MLCVVCGVVSCAPALLCVVVWCLIRWGAIDGVKQKKIDFFFISHVLIQHFSMSFSVTFSIIVLLFVHDIQYIHSYIHTLNKK